MQYLASFIISAITFIGLYNYLPLDLVAFNHGVRTFGSTITTIQGSDTLSASRSVINTNFANLNSDKIENSTTSVKSITTLSSLSSIGTITTGVWNGTAVTVPYGGTGSTTLGSNLILLGNGTSNIKTVTGLGSSGEVLMSNGAGLAPSWQSSSVNQTVPYTWTAHHIFSSLFATSASSTNATTTNLTVTGNTIGIFPKATSTTFTTSGTWVKPSGVDRVFVRVVGGGGRGGNITSNNGAGGGGGAGAYCEANVAVTGNVTVTVGGTTTPSSFAGVVTVTAGVGSQGTDTSAGGGTAGGAGGTCTNANVASVTGQTGASGISNTQSGHGGSNPMGFGRTYSTSAGAGSQGTGYGAGGSGALRSGSDVLGGDGTGGVVIVEWYQSQPY